MMASLANSAWIAGCLPEHLRFRAALGRVRVEQERILLEIVRRNERSDFGLRHEFGSIRSVEDYRRRIPLSEYDDYRLSIDRIAAGESQVLTSEPVRLFEPTSGSSSAAKWIPYTRSLQREFQRGIRAWVADLFLHNPDLVRGPAWWSVSPVCANCPVTPGGIPVGFADDTEYVGGLQRRLVRAVMAVPSSVRSSQSIEEFRLATLRHLVRRPDLRFISVWNPSFLALLVELLPLLEDEPAVKSALRASTLADRHARLWPNLRVISCWTDAGSAPAARQVATLFPYARISPKGLIATEAFVSFPWEASEGAAVFAARSHFVEFLPLGADLQAQDDCPVLAHELEPDRDYAVVLTTGGGFYRYRLHDIVTVVGRCGECPLLRFVGRRRVSDFCGEKLHELHVARATADAFARHSIASSFAMLALDTEAPRPGYVLYVDSEAGDDRLAAAASSLEGALQENFHYRYARRLDQLGPVRLFLARNAHRSYIDACVSRGQRGGDVKPVSLHASSGWTVQFEGRFIDSSAPAERDISASR